MHVQVHTDSGLAIDRSVDGLMNQIEFLDKQAKTEQQRKTKTVEGTPVWHIGKVFALRCARACSVRVSKWASKLVSE